MEVKSKDELLKEANELIAEMQEALERIGEAGLELATVLDITGKYAVLSNNVYAINNNFKIGQNVLVYPRSGQVVEAITYNIPFGDLVTISKVLDGPSIELNIKGERKLVSKGAFKNLKDGDIVILDHHQKVVQALFESPSKPKKITETVSWGQIGGNEEAKRLLIEAVELPYKHKNLYKAYKQQNTKGILLHGPAGCGKTLLGKAVATSIGTEDGFIFVKGPEVLDPYVGVAEATIRSLFVKAKHYKHKNNKSAVIFIDEAEALLTARGTRNNFMGQTIVPMFLAEMDGIDKNDAIVILSTNHAKALDAAIIRDGRIDFKVEVTRPDAKQAKEIMSIHINSKPIAKKHKSPVELVEKAVDDLYQHPLPFSGALIAGCVHKAVTHALRRDTANGCLTGLSDVDFEWATKQIIKQEVGYV